MEIYQIELLRHAVETGDSDSLSELPNSMEVKEWIADIELGLHPEIVCHKHWIKNKGFLYSYAGLDSVENRLNQNLSSNSAIHQIINISVRSLIKKAQKGEITPQEKLYILSELHSVISELTQIDVSAAIESAKKRKFKYKPFSAMSTNIEKDL